MSWHKSTFLVSGLALCAISSAQLANPLPPPPFNGQSFWCGPGPQPCHVKNSVMDCCGWADSCLLTGGGPAFTGIVGPPPTPDRSGNVTAYFNVCTNLTVECYMYVDGYFGVTATVCGMDGGANSSTNEPPVVVLGTSRFYVLHNCPIDVKVGGLTPLTDAGGTNTIDSFFDITYKAYGLPGDPQIGATTTLMGAPGGSGFFDVFFDLATDGCALEADITRRINCRGKIPAGTYTSNGQVIVTLL